MRHFSGKEKIIVTSVLWAAVIVGTALGIVFPLFLRVQNFSSVYPNAFYRLQELETNIDKFALVKAEFTQISSNIPRLRQLLLNPADAVVFIEALEELAKDNQLFKEIQLVSEPGGTGKQKSSFVFQMTLVGSYAHLMQFLVHLENFNYAVDVEQISLKATQATDTFGAYNPSGGRTFSASPGDIAASITLRVHSL